MDGAIAQLIGSKQRDDRIAVWELFGPQFQTMRDWRSYLRVRLADNASAQLMASKERWNVSSFHALFIACWIHHPVEKGTYMVNLGGLSVSQRDVVKNAYKKHLSGRRSSHLSTSGRSASKGWDFLNGYAELLVQFEETTGRPYLFLKAEGHNTGLKGIIPHIKSWRHKKKHGVGLIASPALNQFAKSDPRVESRAAENYGKHYKKLVKGLKLRGKKVTVREVVPALFKLTGYPHPNLKMLAMTSSNQELGRALLDYCRAASTVGSGGVRFRADGKITGGMISDLKELAGTLQQDGTKILRRVFREVRVNPDEVDRSLLKLYASPG